MGCYSDGRRRIKGSLPKEFNWDIQWAAKRNRKGRARGGMLMGVRKDLERRNEDEWREREGIMMKRVKIGREWWRVIGVYVSEGNGGIEGVDGEEGGGDENIIGGGF